MNTNYKVRASFDFPEQYNILFLTYTDCFNQQGRCIQIRDARNDSVLTDWSVSKSIGNQIYLDIKHAVEGDQPEKVIDWIEWTLDDNRECKYHPFSWMPKAKFAILLHSGGGTTREFMSGLRYSVARKICTENGWAWADENAFVWNMEIVERA